MKPSYLSVFVFFLSSTVAAQSVVVFDARSGDPASTAVSISQVQGSGQPVFPGHMAAEDFVSVNSVTVERVRLWIKSILSPMQVVGPVRYSIYEHQRGGGNPRTERLIETREVDIAELLPNGSNRFVLEFDLAAPVTFDADIYWLEIYLPSSINVGWEQTDFTGLDNPHEFYTFPATRRDADATGAGSVVDHYAFQMIGHENPATLEPAASEFGPETITRDHRTGLDWLDMTLTDGRSYTDVSGELGAGGEFEGFRYASSGEVLGLFQSAGIPSPSGSTSANYLPTINLVRLIGFISPLSHGDDTFFFGLTGSFNGARVVVSRISASGSNFNAQVEYASTTHTVDNVDSDQGSWLVRTSPTIPVLEIPSAVPAATGETVTVPVDFRQGAAEVPAVAFSVDFDETCLAMDGTDDDADGLPDSFDFALPPEFARSVFLDFSDTDGEIDVFVANLPPASGIPDGTFVTMTFETICDPAATGAASVTAPVRFSSDPAASFGDLAGADVPGTTEDGSVLILAGIRGDANGDGYLSAGDLSALGLEIFDGDGDGWLDVPGGAYPGNPVGSDANADTLVDAGDVACVGRLIFGLACGAEAGRAPVGTPLLVMAPVIESEAGKVLLPISFESRGNPITSVVFSVFFDLERVSFDPDAESAVSILGPGSFKTWSFSSDGSTGRLDFLITDLAAEPDALAEGRLVEIEFEAIGGQVTGSARFAPEPDPSFGSTAGGSVRGRAVEGLFQDGFEDGDLSGWSRAVGGVGAGTVLIR